jgi:RPA family protein
VITADIGPLRYRDVQPYTASAYRPLQQGVFVVGHAGAREVVTPEARSFLSVVLLPDRVAVMSDERHTDPARAQIVIYNFHSEPVSFEALRPEAVLVPEVDPGGRGQRVVNAITVTLGAVAAEILFSQELELRRGESYTLVVLDSSSEPSGFVVQAAVASE